MRSEARDAYPHEDRSRRERPDALGERRLIGRAGRRPRDLVVPHAARDQRIRCIGQRVAQRIVGRTVRAQQHVAGFGERVERGDDRVRTAHDREPGKHFFGAKIPRQQRLVALARRVIVAVTGAARKIALGDTFIEKRPQDARDDRTARRIASLERRERALRRRAHARIQPPFAEQQIDHAARAVSARS